MGNRLSFVGCAALARWRSAPAVSRRPTTSATPPAGVPRSGTVATTTADGSIVLLRGGAVFAVLSGDASSWYGDRVTIVADGRVMLNATRHDRAEVSFVGDAETPRTYSNTGEHTQESGASRRIARAA